MFIPLAAQSPILVVIKVVIILFITMFIPATAYSFFRFRLRKKEAEFERVLSILGISGEKRSRYFPSIRSEYTPFDYVLPVMFCTFTVMLTMTLLLFGGWMITLGSGVTNNLLLAGPDFLRGGERAYARESVSMLVITFALIGAYFWSAQNIVRRLITADLSPGTYYNSGIRMIMAALVALMISFLTPVYESIGYQLVTAFLVGMFPERGIRYLIAKVAFLSQKGKHESHPLPLEMIEGISLFHRVRFAEVGIDNAQNLAETNLLILLIRTPFDARKLLDWMMQAKLAIYTKDDFSTLLDYGIRTVYDLSVVGEQEGALKAVADQTGVSELKLQNVHHRIKADQSLQNLFEFQSRMHVVNEYTPGV